MIPARALEMLMELATQQGNVPTAAAQILDHKLRSALRSASADKRTNPPVSEVF